MLRLQFSPTLTDIKSIVTHLQSPSNETETWPLLAQHLNSITGRVFDANEWKQILSHLVKRLSARQQLVHRKVISFEWARLCDAERQLIALLTEDSDVPNEFPESVISWDVRESEVLSQMRTHCRICLASNSSQMIDIFDEKRKDDVTLFEKIRICQCFTKNPEIGDAYPQKICLSCSILVENAYQLKMLCTSTEDKFKEISMEISPANLIQKIDENDLVNTSIESNSMEQCNNEVNMLIDFDHVIMQPDNILVVEEVIDSQPVQQTQPIEQFICDMCQSTFQSKFSTSRHMELIHAPKAQETATFECPTCPKTFTKHRLLLSHIKTHNTARPYMCNVSSPFCSRSFS